MNQIDSILALNGQHEVETSALTRGELQAMLDCAFYTCVAAGGTDGFLISFDQDADYDSRNFLWFKERYDKFVYIDRIIVAKHGRRSGLAKRFYGKLFEKARNCGHKIIGCEINVEPPNPGSMRFHQTWGFEEIEEVRLNNNKSVSYQVACL